MKCTCASDGVCWYCKGSMKTDYFNNGPKKEPCPHCEETGECFCEDCEKDWKEEGREVFSYRSRDKK